MVQLNAPVARFEITPSDMRWRCDAALFKFECTDDLAPPAGFIGQERASSAMEVGLGIDRPGFNVFVTGPSGTGRTALIKSHVEAAARRMKDQAFVPPAGDWCYVFNFDQNDQPSAIRFPPGEGKVFAGRVTEILETITRDLRNAFQSEAYQREVKRLADDAEARRQEQLREIEQLARERDFAVQVTPVGVAMVPLRKGKPIERSDFLALSDQEQAVLEAHRKEILAAVDLTMAKLHELEHARQEAVRKLNEQVAERTVEFPFAAIDRHYEGHEKAIRYLTGLRRFTLEHISVFLESDSEAGPQSGPQTDGTGPTQSQPFLPFRVNLFVDTSGSGGMPPVIFEPNPTYANMFGQIERRPMMGTYVTDHTMLRAGSLVKASGGFLVVQAQDVLRQPAVWEALKRVLKGGEVRPEDPSDLFWLGLLPQGLRPEPIPIRVKVIMFGEPLLYHLLATYDLDFWNIFKVRADLELDMPNSRENLESYASLVCGMVKTHQLRPVDRTGVAELAEFGARLAEDRTKLTNRFGIVRDVLIEANFWADRDSAPLIGGGHVRQALEHRVYRTSRIADRIRELMVRNVLLVDLKGLVMGQVNGLAVYDLGDIAFGKPSRITARTFMGRQGVVNIEREAKLSGSTHDKGVLILAGLLGARYAQEHPLSLSVSIAFEQSYEGVEGDSASSTELYAILSSLSGLPVKQNIAVTGSVNQMGQIQPIGGVNEKIEGFFDVCREAGALGDVGVIIPKQNVDSLALRHDVIEASERGEFHIYAIGSIDEGIEILTGVPAGSYDRGTWYPTHSVNGLVADRLKKFAAGMRGFDADGHRGG